MQAHQAARRRRRHRMTRVEFIQHVIEYGIELLAPRKADPRRRGFIEHITRLGEAVLEAQEQHLQVFEEEILSNPARLRWELLGRTALDRKQLAPKQLTFSFQGRNCFVY